MAEVLKMKSIILLIIALILIVFISVNYTSVFSEYHSIPALTISIDEARRRRFGLIIDVRSPKEREQLGYYPNSIPISVETLPYEIGKLTSKATSILVYANGDNRAKIAAEKLYTIGFHHVRYITSSYLSLMPRGQ